jgi:hypothetical protein
MTTDGSFVASVWPDGLGCRWAMGGKVVSTVLYIRIELKVYKFLGCRS